MNGEGTTIKGVLPDKGIWTLADLAKYLNMNTAQLQQRLTDNGIKLLMLTNRSKHKLIRLEDLRVKKVKEEK